MYLPIILLSLYNPSFLLKIPDLFNLFLIYCPQRTFPCDITSSVGTLGVLQPIVCDNFLETTSPTLLNRLRVFEE